MADVVGAAAEGEHKLDAGEIVPVINTEETKGRLLKSIMISSLEHGNPNQRFPQLDEYAEKMVRAGTAAAALAELPAAWENGLRTLMAQTLHTMSSANALMTQRVMAPPSNAEPSAAAALPFQTLDYLDWQAAMTIRSTRHKLTDTTGTLRRRPRDAAAFIRRWGSVCEIVRGKCTPRSRWIDQQGPALTLDVGD